MVLSNDPFDVSPKVANVTLTTNADWPPGSLVFSILSGTDMPIDDLLFFVDGQQFGGAREMDAFETRRIQLPPGEHNITFSYMTNPVGVDSFPPFPLGRIGAVFIDDVYFLPVGATISPTTSSSVQGSTTPTSKPTESISPTETVSIVPVSAAWRVAVLFHVTLF